MWRVAEYRAVNESGINIYRGMFISKKSGTCIEYPKEVVFHDGLTRKDMGHQAFLDYCDTEGLGQPDHSVDAIYQAQAKIFSCFEWRKAKYVSCFVFHCFLKLFL